mgnify:FL=1
MRSIPFIATIFALSGFTGCDFEVGVGGGYGGTGYGYGDCSSYGTICEGQSYEAGAFEALIVPYADYTYGVTVTVTFKDAAAGEDVITTAELTPDYNGEYWFYSPSAPPDGKVEIEAVVYVQADYAIDGMCDDAPAADLVAYNNFYELDVDYRGSSPCYAKVDLRDVVN